MNVHLLHPDRDFDMEAPLSWNAEALVKDLELSILFISMAKKDEFIHKTVEKVILNGFEKDIETLMYRQNIVKDCIGQADSVRELYALAVEAVELAQKQYWGILDRYPEWVLRRSVEYMEEYVVMLEKIRRFSELHSHAFVSPGWRAFFKRLDDELSDTYIAEIEHHLKRLKFPDGVLLGARLGTGNKASCYTLHQPPLSKQNTLLSRAITWLRQYFGLKTPVAKRKGQKVFNFFLNPRDESGSRALSDLRNRGISTAAATLAQSTFHVSGFFTILRTELAFYIGCLNVHDRLVADKRPFCFPLSTLKQKKHLSFQGLYDCCLALESGRNVVGNEAKADDKDLVVITGANQGGKSTFLRSVGLAQVMMQCGMFVAANVFRSSICDCVFTHFKREEDAGMVSGKLDEELCRMSEIIEHIKPYSMILFNESFSATNEREGSEIARQILSALVEIPTRILCVTHLFELARGFFEMNSQNILFLRADREKDGSRSFKLTQAEPLRTSFGEDLYNKIFLQS